MASPWSSWDGCQKKVELEVNPVAESLRLGEFPLCRNRKLVPATESLCHLVIELIMRLWS